MKNRILDALGRARAGWSELRLRRIWASTVLVRDGVLDSAGAHQEQGGLARCFSPGTALGAAGFTDPDHLDASLLRAHELSLAAAPRHPARLAPVPVRQHETSPEPSEGSRVAGPDLRRDRVLGLAARVAEADRRIASSRILARDEVIETFLANSEGTWLYDLRSRISIAILVQARQGGTVERSLGSRFIRTWDDDPALEDLVDRIAARAVEQLEAAPVRPRSYPVVLDPAAAGVLLHRVVSHLARPALPGADPDALPLGTRLGPEGLTLGDDPTAPGQAPSCAYDDEGTEARRTTIVQNGVVLGHLHSRETAAAAGQAPTGHARAGTLQGLPAPRASNSFLAPGSGSLEDLLEGISSGVFLSDATGCEYSESGLVFRPAQARMIRDGRLAEPVKGVRVSGELLDILGRFEAAGADFEWDSSAAHCRDGNGGLVPVTTGSPPVRFRDLEIGCELT